MRLSLKQALAALPCDVRLQQNCALCLDVAARSVAQVCSVLESLEQEYKREEDWCGGADKLGPNSESDHVTPMISKHLEQKEAFLKVTQLLPFGWRGTQLGELSNRPAWLDVVVYCFREILEQHLFSFPIMTGLHVSSAQR